MTIPVGQLTERHLNRHVKVDGVTLGILVGATTLSRYTFLAVNTPTGHDWLKVAADTPCEVT